MKQKLEMKPQQTQRTRLVLTPAMHQSLQILQFGTQGLVDYLNRVTEVNPFLTVTRPRPRGPEVLFEQTQSTTLREELRRQLRITAGSQELLMNAFSVVDLLDKAGYLTLSVDQAMQQLNLSPEQWQAAFEMVRHLDPAGVGATDLTDCLAMQAARISGFSDLPLTILKNRQLEQLANPDQWEELIADYKIDKVHLAAALAEIRTLDPRPGYGYDNQAATQYVIPDLVFERDGDAGLTVKLGAAADVRVSFDRDGYENLQQRAEGDAQQYLQAQYTQYKRLASAVERRQQTLIRIGTSFANAQYAYVVGKSAHPAVLTMTQVANEVGVTTATVSRAVKDKYVRVYKGIIPMRELFQRPVGKTGQTVDRLQNEILSLMQDEDPGFPYTDDQISALMEDKGYVISRRTVANIRNRAGIGSSYTRKRHS